MSLLFDATFIGGLSIVVFCVLWATGSRTPTIAAQNLYFNLAWIVIYPHFAATLLRLFRTRRSASQYPMTAFFLPVVIVGATVAGMSWPKTFAPYLVKLVLVWTSFHFSAQNLGISLIYARRSGVALEGRSRLVLSLFLFCTYLVALIRIDNLAGSFYGVDYPTIELPAWLLDVAWWGTWGTAGFLAAWAISWTTTTRRPFPILVLLPAITQFVWFVPGLSVPDYYLFVPLLHALQYLPIGLAMHLGDVMGENTRDRSPERLRREIAKWIAVIFTGGVFLFFFVPRAVSWLGVDFPIAAGVLFATMQIHHFIVDGVIWKLRNYGVASPLMVNLRSYGRASA